MKIFIAEGMHPRGVEVLRNNEVTIFTPDDSFDQADIDALVVRSVFEVNKESLRDFKNLKIVAKLGTGLDNVDQDLCLKKNILVLNAPGMNAISTAEFTVAEILNYYKNLSQIHQKASEHDFRRSLYYGRELRDLKAGVIGYGEVGKNVASRLAPFVKEVFVSSRSIKPSESTRNLTFVSDLNQLLAHSDVIVFAMYLKGNEKMVNRDFLSRVKHDVFLVNPARGGIVDEHVLIEFLTKNKTAHYYCDVIDHEPNYFLPPTEQAYSHPLLKLPNVTYTPHIAGMTKECQEKISVHIAKKLIEYSLSHMHGDKKISIPVENK